ncbi:MAG TPA: single-stranded-DNA-specific exonuclease RecJ [Amoebophilaceae bacterium]|nr:single-stranded-DNA-specific exonuclease RecJ [Amoebophilaceae bacterium]
MHKQWVLQSIKDAEKIEAISTVLGTPCALSHLLVSRAIATFSTAKAFFRPSLEALHDPFCMKGMEQAVARLMDALFVKNEKILVYGDYDVDGTTAVSMVYAFLAALPGAHVTYYIPDRMTEGYGVSLQAIEQARHDGVTLIVTLDCGIKAYAPIAQAVELGIDVIVCDHHQVGDLLPPAYAILNPKQADCRYPFTELSGCGIGFKLLQAFCQKTGRDLQALYPYLDLVAVSTACDLVPLIDENRIITYHGLKQLEHAPRPGLHALLQLGGLTAPLTISDIVFKIGPRINAAGRISHAALAVELLMEKDCVQAQRLACLLDRQNRMRQELDETITQEALETIARIEQKQPRKSHVLFNKNWHKGIVGIVASRCIEQYHRPTIVLTLSNGKATGSARSIPGYNIYEAIVSCGELLHQYGGHACAAGLTLSVENLLRFQERFEQVVQRTLADGLLIPQQVIHSILPFPCITRKFVSILLQMAPFGSGNPTPVFASNKVYVHTYRVLKGLHLKLELYQAGFTERYTAIGFGLAQHEPLVASGKPLSIAYSIGYNVYLGNRSIQLVVRDIKSDEQTVAFFA